MKPGKPGVYLLHSLHLTSPPLLSRLGGWLAITFFPSKAERLRLWKRERCPIRAGIQSCRALLTVFGLGLVLPMRTDAASCVAPPSGLISWWRAEGNANDVLGGNNGTLQGSTTFASGEVGQAFIFNSPTDSVQIADAPNLDFGSTSPLTIEFWAYRTGGETTMHLLGKR